MSRLSEEEITELEKQAQAIILKIESDISLLEEKMDILRKDKASLLRVHSEIKSASGFNPDRLKIIIQNKSILKKYV